jgi:hypothetical protein
MTGGCATWYLDADINIRCPFITEMSMGGVWVDDAYCRSHFFGAGCKALNRCVPRWAAGYGQKVVTGTGGVDD